MRAQSLPYAVLALTLALTACQPAAQPPAGLSEEDKATIAAASEAFVESLLAQDYAAVAAHYTEDAVFMPPNGPAVQGRANIEAWMQAFPAVTEFTLENVEVVGVGDLAYVRGVGTMTFMPEGAPGSVQDVFKYVEIRRKQADGSWPMVTDIFNSDMPLPE